MVSEDKDFFEYIIPKLAIRKYDELFRFSFDEIPEKLHLMQNSLIIINSENNKEQTLELLEILKNNASIVFSFNDDEEFRIDAYKAGMFDYITILTKDKEFEAKVSSALNYISSLEKNNMYREILVKNNIITKHNEVFLDYVNILDRELAKIQDKSASAILVAISPDEKTKFLIQPNQVETIILNNVRKNDILMNYATNKYFLLLYDTDIESAYKIWEKIYKNIPEKIYAGFAQCLNKSRQQVVNEVLNRLHEAINVEKNMPKREKEILPAENFKLFRQEFNKKIDQIISPVFYHIQQKYNNKLFGTYIEQNTGEGFGNLNIKGKYSSGSFKITSPGATAISIDITYQSNSMNENKKNIFPKAKRITLEPKELESGLIEDLLEQFILEFKSEVNNEFS